MATGTHTHREQKLTCFDEDEDSAVDRINQYLDNPDSFRVRIPNDVELYRHALKCDLGELIFKFVNILKKYPLDTQFAFINKIPLYNAEIRVGSQSAPNPMLEYIFELLNWSSLELLSNISIDMYASTQHEYLYDYLEQLKTVRHDMYPIAKSYDAPHVILSLCKKPENEEMLCAKYFNGVRWCRLQVDGNINSIIPLIETHKSVIFEDDMWYVKGDSYLAKKNLFRDDDVKYFPLPMPLPQDSQLCSNGDDIVIFSNQKQMAEIVPTHFSNASHKVSEMKKLTSCETISHDEYHDIYRVKSPELGKTMNVCFSKTDTSLLELDGDTLCEYVVIPHHVFRQTSSIPKHKHYIIPKDSNQEDWVLTLIKTKTMKDYISNFITTQTHPQTKRRLLKENNPKEESSSYQFPFKRKRTSHQSSYDDIDFDKIKL